MTNTGPKVSVVITAYNKEDFITRAVESVQAQTERSVEIIVVDDASRDATCAIVRDLAEADDRIRVIALNENGGQPAALNVGVLAARGDWVAILDGDDWVAPELYATLLELAGRYGASVVSSNMQWVDDGEMHPWRTLFPVGDGQPLALSAVAFVRRSMPDQMMAWSFLQPMVRRGLFVEKGVRFFESDPFDMDFCILVSCILAAGNLVVTPRPLYYYRQVEGSMMSIRSAKVLRQTRRSNDSLVSECRRAGDDEAARWIDRRGGLIDREVNRAEIVEATKRGAWGRALALALPHPGDVWSLTWRRFRGPIYWRRRRRSALRAAML